MCSVAHFLDHIASDDLLLQTSTERRRIDEDFMQYVCHKAMTDHRARTFGSFVQASGLVAETTASTMVESHMCQ